MESYIRNSFRDTVSSDDLVRKSGEEFVLGFLMEPSNIFILMKLFAESNTEIEKKMFSIYIYKIFMQNIANFREKEYIVLANGLISCYQMELDRVSCTFIVDSIIECFKNCYESIELILNFFQTRLHANDVFFVEKIFPVLPKEVDINISMICKLIYGTFSTCIDRINSGLCLLISIMEQEPNSECVYSLLDSVSTTLNYIDFNDTTQLYHFWGNISRMVINEYISYNVLEAFISTAISIFTNEELNLSIRNSVVVFLTFVIKYMDHELILVLFNGSISLAYSALCEYYQTPLDYILLISEIKNIVSSESLYKMIFDCFNLIFESTSLFEIVLFLVVLSETCDKIINELRNSKEIISKFVFNLITIDNQMIFESVCNFVSTFSEVDQEFLLPYHDITLELFDCFLSVSAEKKFMAYQTFFVLTKTLGIKQKELFESLWEKYPYIPTVDYEYYFAAIKNSYIPDSHVQIDTIIGICDQLLDSNISESLSYSIVSLVVLLHCSELESGVVLFLERTLCSTIEETVLYGVSLFQEIVLAFKSDCTNQLVTYFEKIVSFVSDITLSTSLRIPSIIACCEFVKYYSDERVICLLYQVISEEFFKVRSYYGDLINSLRKIIKHLNDFQINDMNARLMEIIRSEHDHSIISSSLYCIATMIKVTSDIKVIGCVSELLFDICNFSVPYFSNINNIDPSVFYYLCSVFSRYWKYCNANNDGIVSFLLTFLNNSDFAIHAVGALSDSLIYINPEISLHIFINILSLITTDATDLLKANLCYFIMKAFEGVPEIGVYISDISIIVVSWWESSDNSNEVLKNNLIIALLLINNVSQICDDTIYSILSSITKVNNQIEEQIEILLKSTNNEKIQELANMLIKK